MTTDAKQVLDLPVPTGKTTLMQHLQTLVLHGNTHWIGGVIEASKLPRLLEKLSGRYPLTRTERGRTYDRSRGLASVHLVAFPSRGGVAWWLLSSDGKGGLADAASADAHVARNARAAAVHIEFEDYVLLYAHKKDARKLVDARTGKERTVVKDTSTWTWKLTPSAYAEALASIESEATAIRYGNDAAGQMFGVKGALAYQRRRPLFSGVRAQVLQMHREAESLWARFRQAWMGKHPKEVASYGASAGELRPIAEVIAHHLPKMGRFKVFGAIRVSDLVAGTFVPGSPGSDTTSELSTETEVEPILDVVAIERALRARLEQEWRADFDARQESLTPDPLERAETALYAAAADVRLKARAYDGGRVKNMRSLNTDSAHLRNPLDVLQARANRIRIAAVAAFEQACKDHDLMVSRKASRFG